MRGERERIERLAAALQARCGAPPAVGVVLGSGWNVAAERVRAAAAVPLAEFAEWPLPRVAGHQPLLTAGELAGRRVALCGGRVHAYEGCTAAELVRGVRALAAWGVRDLLLLNAAGSLREERPPGACMPFADHLNLSLPNPLAADQTLDGTAQFLDLVDLYHPEWRLRLLQARRELVPGVYAGLAGPSYETPAEVAMLQWLGADAVGMSTVPEAIAARAAGARVLAISLLTNFAAGIGGSRPSHGEVLETARAHAAAAADVLEAAVAAAP